MPESQHESRKELSYKELCSPVEEGDIILRTAIPDLGPNIEVEFVTRKESADK